MFYSDDGDYTRYLFFYLNNLIEKKNFESAKQSKNISRSEFLPSITLSGDQTSTTSTNRTNQSGTNLADSNSDSESKKISVEQKIFSGFKGLNTFKRILKSKEKKTGCTVHFVEEKVDSGRIIKQSAVPVLDADDNYTLLKRIQKEEHKIVSHAIELAGMEWRSVIN